VYESDPDDRLLTASEVAERMGFSADWVLDRFEAGDVPGYRFGRKGGPVRFLWADWEGFLQRCRVGPTLNRQLHEA
jgi:hypothetical protein